MIKQIRRFFRAGRKSRIDKAVEAYQMERLRLRARYDAAQTTDENRKHWNQVDSLDANSANSPAVRRTLRNRARYERDNNGYVNGLIETLATDLVGTGPRLQLKSKTLGKDVTLLIEAEFRAWAKSIGLASKLRTMHETRVCDGECFAMFATNPRAENLVQLDLMLFEGDQCTTPDLNSFDPKNVDGIIRDNQGRPLQYHFLKYHPGSVSSLTGLEYDTYDAGEVIHWFKARRPNQSRGIPEIVAGLPLCAQMRRYTLAVLGAAEFAAAIHGVLHTNAPAEEGEAVDPEIMDRIEIARGALLTLPHEWDVKQLQANQPMQNYGEFKGEILNEIGRGVSAPFNVVAGNSSKYNYSSGRLDHMIYHRAVWVLRDAMEEMVIDRVFRKWLDEALLIEDYLPRGDYRGIKVVWHWNGFGSIDPLKDANAVRVRLESGQTTLSEVFAENGLDWEEALEQRAREIARANELAAKYGVDPALLLGLQPRAQVAEVEDEEQVV